MNANSGFSPDLGRGIGRPLASAVTEGLGGFNPLSLFAAGEQGAVYDPSRLDSLYQDAAGTTPVTAMEQPVGLMLDGRFGLVRGPELITDGEFDNPASWFLTQPTSGTVSVSGGVARIYTADGSYAAIGPLNAFNTVPGKRYEYEITITAVAAGSIAVSIGATQGPQLGSVGTFRGSLVSTNTDTALIKRGIASACDATVTHFSVREIPGNHASQATAAARPVVSARVNLLVKTEDLTDANWVATSATKDSARQATLAAGFTSRIQQSGPTSPVGTTMTFSVKLSGSGKVQLYITDEGGAFPSSTSAILTLDGNPTLYTVTRTQTDAASTRMSARIVNAQGGTPATVLVDEPQLETGSTATRYQRVNTATDYDTVGFPVYLKFDGVDDGLVTGSVDFTATDKVTAWVGVTKMSDAGYNAIVDFSTDPNNVNNTFCIGSGTLTGDASRRTYGGFMRGTANVGATGGATYAAPHKAVVSTAFDKAAATQAAQILLRVNGASPPVLNYSLVVEPGNFSTQPLYIGRRGGTTLPFTGNFYGAVIRGAASTAAQIASTERYLANKAGVTL